MGEIRLDGRVAIITGAGGGLGAAYARLFGARGAQLLLNDLKGADAMAAEIRGLGGEATHNALSVSERGSGEAIVKAAVDAGSKAAGKVGELVGSHILARPHEDLMKVIVGEPAKK